jgi:hypothetical protein
MDPRQNPYSPGAGTRPPELTGRDEIIEKVNIQLDRCRNGLSYRSVLMVGLRGVGKTVLLNTLASNAEANGFVAISIEVPEKRSLPALLAPALRSALLKLDRANVAGDLAKRALRVLGGFVGAMKMKYQDVEFGLNLGSELGVADSGDLENDLTDLFIELGGAAKEKKTAIVIFIDEIQYIEESQFAALIMAVHKCTQKQLPLIVAGAGLPQLIAQAGRAKSYAERLFEYPEIGALAPSAAKDAILKPALKLGVKYEDEALEEILNQTKCYPYFLQEWGKHSWQCASNSLITAEDVDSATKLAISDLDASFFRTRLDRLTPSEKRYVRAMAEIGTTSQRSGDIARLLGKAVNNVAPIRQKLIEKGMIYSSGHGDNSFTVPLFDGYLKRVIPIFEN